VQTQKRHRAFSDIDAMLESDDLAAQERREPPLLGPVPNSLVGGFLFLDPGFSPGAQSLLAQRNLNQCWLNATSIIARAGVARINAQWARSGTRVL
jgi:hypothetical protein